MVEPGVEELELPEEDLVEFQKLVDLLADFVDVSAALIMKHEPPYLQVCRTNQSAENPFVEGTNQKSSHLYCKKVVETGEKLLIPDARKKTEWEDNPALEEGLISYLGFPLRWPDGTIFGTLCVLDREAGPFDEKSEAFMCRCKESVEAHLESVYQSERRFQRLLETTNDGFFLLDRDGEVLKANRTYTEMVGYDRQELKGMHISELAAGATSGDSRRRIREIKEAGGEVFEIRQETKSGSEIDVELSVNYAEESDRLFAFARDVTERKQFEEKLQSQRDRAERYFEKVGAIMVVLDSEGKVRRINERGCRALGYEKSELLGADWFDRVIPAEVEAEIKDLFEALRKNETAGTETFENPVITREGEVRTFIWYNTPLCDETGEDRAVLSSGMDITERKRAEERIEHLNSLLEAIRKIHRIIIQENEMRTIARKACEALYETRSYLGCTIALEEEEAEEISPVATVGKHHQAKWFKSETAEISPPECIRQALESEKIVINDPRECEGCGELMAGEDYLSATLALRRGGEAVGALHIEFDRDVKLDAEEQELLVDVADDLAFAREKIKADEQLRESEEKYRAIVENSHDAIFIYRKHQLEFVNSRATELTGYSRQQLYSMEIWDLIHPEDRERVRNIVRRRYQGKEVPNTYEARLLTAEGEVIIGAFSGKLINYGGGEVVLGAMRDITEQKEYEQALEESLEEKEILLKEVHHRVKNNLFNIVSLLRIQEDRSEDERIERALNQSISRVHSLALIHKEIYGGEEYDQLNFGEYLKRMIGHLEQSFLAPQQEITVEYDLDEWVVELDRALPCALVVNELVNNAFSHGFADRSEGILRVELRVSETQIQLKVADNGQGLPEDFSLPEAASLGLKLVDDLVTRQLKGSLDYEKGQWTAFEVEFPRKR